MKLIRVIASDGFKTYAINKVERVTYKNKDYIVSRFIDAPKTNVLTIAKQRIALKLLEEGKDISEIADLLGVSGASLITWYSSYMAEIHNREGQKKATSARKRSATDGIGRPTKQVVLADRIKNQILVFVSLSACADYLGVSSSTVYNYCNNNKLFRNRYKLSYKEES